MSSISKFMYPSSNGITLYALDFDQKDKAPCPTQETDTPPLVSFETTNHYPMYIHTYYTHHFLKHTLEFSSLNEK